MNQKAKPYIYLLASMYLAGGIGLNLPLTNELFKFLTPFNLLSSVGILLYFHQDWNKSAIVFCIITFSVGFLVELAGVNTGLIFGHYQYATTLGFKVGGVPPMIGVNWLLLIYCVGTVTEYFVDKIAYKILLGALFMTAFDYIVEPVAIKFDMWFWENGLPPIQNYVAWFVVSAALLTLFHLSKFRKTNPIAAWLLGFQVLFFLIG